MTALSKELETMVKKLIGRIDQGLSFSANSMKERTDQTEMRMRSMLQRVDEGITAAAAIQEDPLVEASPNRATGGTLLCFVFLSCITLSTRNYGSYGIWRMQGLYHQP